MKFKNLLLTGLVAIVAGASGCQIPNSPKGIAVYPVGEERYFESDINRVKSEGIVPIPSKITDERYEFDDALACVGKIKYKAEPILQDYIQTPEETEKLGSGDCDDFAMYFSKLLTDREIYNEFVVGRVLRKDGLVLHCWNRVFLNGKKFLIDPTKGLRLLEEEVPSEIYHEYYSFAPAGYSWNDMRGYEKEINQAKILPFLRDNFTGDPNQRIIGGNVR